MAESFLPIDFDNGVAYSASAAFLLLVARHFWLQRVSPWARRVRHPFLDIVDVIDMSVHRAHSAASSELRPAPVTAANPSPAEGPPSPAGTALE